MAYITNSIKQLWITVFLICFVTDMLPCRAVPICRESFYPLGNECRECPQPCELCTSNEACTKCKDNQYGPACEMTCKPDCLDGICHKKYGYCTFGCADSTFPTRGAMTCEPCSTGCKHCSSASECFVCQKGFYGKACQHHCPDTCADNKCDRSTGVCFACKEGYIFEDGTCLRCPDGCARCDGYGGNCTKCKGGFYGPIAGKCIVECAQTNGTSRQFLAKREDKCGVSRQQLHNAAQNCSEHSACWTETFCVQLCKCSSDERCSAVRDRDQNVCATVMSETCKTHCKASHTGDKENAKYLCNQTCSTRESEDDTHRSVCFYSNTIISGSEGVISDALVSISVHCLPEASPKQYFPETGLVDAFWLPLAVACMVLLVLVILSFLLYQRFRAFSKPSICRRSTNQTKATM